MGRENGVDGDDPGRDEMATETERLLYALRTANECRERPDEVGNRDDPRSGAAKPMWVEVLTGDGPG